jgi:hypothetical protein
MRVSMRIRLAVPARRVWNVRLLRVVAEGFLIAVLPVTHCG